MLEKAAKWIEKSGARWGILLLLAVIGVMLMLGDVGGEESSLTTSEALTKRTEEKIKSLCEQVSGAGRTTVAVTYEESIAVFSDGEACPQIGGIGIVCEGGDDPVVVKKLLYLVSAACGVPTGRIYIVGAEKDASSLS